MTEVKSTDMHCILTTNINKCCGEKTHQAGVSPEGGLEVGEIF